MKYKVTIPEHDLRCILRDIVAEERGIKHPDISFHFSGYDGKGQCFNFYAEVEWEEEFV